MTGFDFCQRVSVCRSFIALLMICGTRRTKEVSENFLLLLFLCAN